METRTPKPAATHPSARSTYTNRSRAVLFQDRDVGRFKVEAAADPLAEIARVAKKVQKSRVLGFSPLTDWKAPPMILQSGAIQPSWARPMSRTLSSRIADRLPSRAAVRCVVGVVLLAAAGLKLYGLGVSAVPRVGWFAQPWVQLAAAEWELALGL